MLRQSLSIIYNTTMPTENRQEVKIVSVQRNFDQRTANGNVKIKMFPD